MGGGAEGQTEGVGGGFKEEITSGRKLFLLRAERLLSVAILTACVAPKPQQNWIHIKIKTQELFLNIEGKGPWPVWDTEPRRAMGWEMQMGRRHAGGQKGRSWTCSRVPGAQGENFQGPAPLHPASVSGV